MQPPHQSPPVNRPQIVYAHLPNVIHPNPNDPMRFLEPFDCGCYLLTETALVMCLATCEMRSR
jgi:hypothetical protein